MKRLTRRGRGGPGRTLTASRARNPTEIRRTRHTWSGDGGVEREDAARMKWLAASFGVAMLGGLLSAAASPEARPGVAAQVVEAVNLCVKIKLPNTMARPEGFDVGAHLAALRADYRTRIRALSTPEGIRQVEAFLAGAPDDAATLCALEIAGETGRPEGIPLLRRYEGSSLSGVSDLVRKYLAMPSSE